MYYDHYGYGYQEKRMPTKEFRQMELDEKAPEVLTNPVYTPAFLRQQIGKLVRVEFLIGSTFLEDRTGILLEVGASYILLRSIQGNNLLYCDIYSIKFVTISEDPFIYNPDIQLASR